MCQFIGPINGTKVGGLESLLNYMNENFCSKDELAVNEHHYHITRKRYNQEFSTHSLYNIGKSKHYKKSFHNFNGNHFNTKKQFITNEVSNYMAKNNDIHNTENILNVKKIIQLVIILTISINHTWIMLTITCIRNNVV